MRVLSRLFILNPLRDLTNRPSGNIAALDAFRSLAVILVMISHFSSAMIKSSGNITWFDKLPFVSGGRVGVDLFFVLSGFLIGSQIWRELKVKGSIDIPQFLLRRGLRIWPLYFFFFLVVFSLWYRGQTDWRGWSDVLFVTNYANRGIVMGSWSLCTEEQFYIVTPLLIMFGVIRRWPLTSYGTILWGILLALPIVRAVTWWMIVGSFQVHDRSMFAQFIYQPFHTHADGLVVGLIIAYYRQIHEFRVSNQFLRFGVALGAIGALAIAGHLLQREVFDFLGVALIFGAMIQHSLMQQAKWMEFSNKLGFYVVSRLSYGMYLNHEYFQDQIALVTQNSLSFLNHSAAAQELFGVTLFCLLATALSLITYCLVEHPFLQLRDVLLTNHQNESKVR